MALGTFSDTAIGQPAATREIAPHGKLRVYPGPPQIGGDAVTYGPDLVLVDNVYVAAPGRTFADAGRWIVRA